MECRKHGVILEPHPIENNLVCPECERMMNEEMTEEEIKFLSLILKQNPILRNY